ncbi:hypothetical protein KP77_25110 [Jeotgalibacillus alimentarius]|uniref:Minor capsid protein n=1 Tax=Jeotgalibacillus alimentarius TaxID=135826 RepID=A0A0C2VDB9_9BACL|nr:phage minor capsid protein [Jeotgalibacillus alimentarius]KIL46942.1 hypothetical protein KP77_25110 [Jeotgalibacillus alimentarius]
MDEKKVEELIAMYEVASFDMLALIQSMTGGLAKRRQLELLKQIGVIISTLNGDVSGIVVEIIEAAYRAGSKEATEEMRIEGFDNIEASFKTKIHKEAVQETLDEAFYSILEASDNMSKDAKERIESIVQKANQRSLVEGVTRKQATQKAIAEATERGITGVVASNGARIPVEKYMAGTIQYHQRKAHVDGRINRMRDNGQDLVRVNSVGITCALCAQFQGRVYSISGRDSRFPTLDRRPPYHSHCVHSTYPWNEEMRDSKEVMDMINRSNRPFADNRTQKDIDRYNQLQREKSRKNETRKQWIKYKSRMPDLPDLKTFSSHKTRNTARYQEWQADFRKFGFILSEGSGT